MLNNAPKKIEKFMNFIAFQLNYTFKDETQLCFWEGRKTYISIKFKGRISALRQILTNNKFIPYMKNCGTPYFTTVLEISTIIGKVDRNSEIVKLIVTPKQRVLVKELKLFNFGKSFLYNL